MLGGLEIFFGIHGKLAEGIAQPFFRVAAFYEPVG
jgi:hypothetical protein